jgi:predicted DNA-binding ribbon-helix-helix protein
MDLNGLTSIIIHPGQVLKIPGLDGEKTFTVTVKEKTWDALERMAEAEGKTVGEIIDEMTEKEGKTWT